MKKDKFYDNFFKGAAEISNIINRKELDDLTKQLKLIKTRNGRIFFLGVGGSAGNCSHAVNDFRKLCNIECYTPLDNVSELTARINDEGWNSSLKKWLEVSKLIQKTGFLFFQLEEEIRKKHKC